MLEEILDKAKALTEAITWARNDDLWKADLTDTANAVKYDDIEDKLLELKRVIENTEKFIYDQDANNHPIWRELQIDPYTYDDFTHLDGSYGDPDAGCEWYKFYWEREEVWVEFQIQVTLDNGRDWGTVWIENWKSEKATIKWLRERGVDEDDELSDEFIIDEAHGLAEIIPFNNGFIINEEKVYIDE